MLGAIRSIEFEADLEALRRVHGDIVEDIYDGLEWELMNVSSFDLYCQVDGDDGYRMILSNPSRRAPQLVLLFGFEDFDGERKLLFVGLKAAETDVVVGANDRSDDKSPSTSPVTLKVRERS